MHSFSFKAVSKNICISINSKVLIKCPIPNCLLSTAITHLSPGHGHQIRSPLSSPQDTVDDPVTASLPTDNNNVVALGGGGGSTIIHRTITSKACDNIMASNPTTIEAQCVSVRVGNGADLEQSKQERRLSASSLESRGNWGNKWEFLLSCIGLSVGIGNVWRFPYLAYENGGGAFLIPYLVMLFLAGKPMYFMELALGQFGGTGPLTIWRCAPIMKGVGAAMVAGSIVVCIYYNVVMSYALYFITQSFQTVLPWTTCNPEWANGTNCVVRSRGVSAFVLRICSRIVSNLFAQFISTAQCQPHCR